VLLSGRTAEKLDRVAAEIAEDGGRVDTRAFDIRDEEAVKAAVAGGGAARRRCTASSTTPAGSSRRR
jgi:NADP-dependent 3-hydroxy acid dehydrogenase YdfG